MDSQRIKLAHGLLACVALLLVRAEAASVDDRPRPSPVGFSDTEFIDAERERTLKVKIWYPAAAGTPITRISYDHIFRGTASPGAPYRESAPRPLILMSHGDKGSNLDQSWLAERLASDGYIVAAVSHFKNVWNDYDPAETLKVWHRPQDLSFVLDNLVARAPWASRVDPARVGAAGHSSGGYTVLALAGAIYAPLQMAAYCEAPGHGQDCNLAKGVALEKIDFSPSVVQYRDVRIRAVFAMAPALGAGLKRDSLSAISIPVDIVAADDDAVLPVKYHAERVAHLIPGARFKRLAGGGHFVFMSECSWLTALYTAFKPFDICRHKKGTDLKALHEDVGSEALDFFNEALVIR